MTDETKAADGPATPLPKPFDAQWQFALTHDGKSVRLIIPTGPEDAMAVDMPASQLAILHATMGQLIDHMRLAKALPPVPPGKTAAPHAPLNWKLGRPDGVPREMGKTVALSFDEGRETADFILLADLDALKVADAIERCVFEGMSEDDKMRMIEEAQKPQKGKIILPPVRKH